MFKSSHKAGLCECSYRIRFSTFYKILRCAYRRFTLINEEGDYRFYRAQQNRIKFGGVRKMLEIAPAQVQLERRLAWDTVHRDF